MCLKKKSDGKWGKIKNYIFDSIDANYNDPPLSTEGEKKSIAIHLVVMVHILGTMEYTIQLSASQIDKLNGIFRIFMQFGMPIFFYFSGRASAFSKDGNLKFAFKKFMRLIVPLFFATFTVVVPTAYFSRGYRDNRCGDPAVGSFFGFYASYCRNFFTDFRKCGFWWLWFLPVLFVVSVYNQPFCKWKGKYERSSFKLEKRDFFEFYLPYTILTAVTVLLSIFTKLKNVFSHKMIGLMTIAFLFNAVYLHCFALVRKHSLVSLNIVCPLITISFAFFWSEFKRDFGRYDELVNDLAASFLFYSLFYLQGFINQIVIEDRIKAEFQLGVKIKAFLLFFMILMMVICLPTSDEEVGDRWVYPLYISRVLRFLFVIGTWHWIFILTKWAETFYDDVLDEFQYLHCRQSTIIIYLLHFLFVSIINMAIVIPQKLNLLTALAVHFVLVFPLCWLLLVPYLGLFFGFRRRITKTIPNEEVKELDHQGIAKI